MFNLTKYVVLKLLKYMQHLPCQCGENLNKNVALSTNNSLNVFECAEKYMSFKNYITYSMCRCCTNFT